MDNTVCELADDALGRKQVRGMLMHVRPESVPTHRTILGKLGQVRGFLNTLPGVCNTAGTIHGIIH